MLVVVPCLNEAATLASLLHQLLREANGALIVVADGGSTDDSRAIVRAFEQQSENIRLLANPRRLQSAGINAAVAAFAHGRDWLVRVDAHCLYPDRYLERLLGAAVRHGADSVVVPMRTRGTTCFQQAAAAAQNSRLGTGGSAHRHVGHGRFVDHGHHALIRLSRFLEVGGYDAAFSHNEDAELDQRLTAIGCKIWLEPSASLLYAPRATAAALVRQYYHYGQGRARTVRKHHVRLKVRQALPLLVAPALIAALIGIMTMAFAKPMALLTLPAIAWLIMSIGYGVIIALRSRSRCALFAGGAAILMHAAWSVGYWQSLVRFDNWHSRGA